MRKSWLLLCYCVVSKLMFVCVVGWRSFVRSFVHSFIRHLFVRSFVRSSCVGRSVGGRSLIPPNSVLPLLSFVHRLSFVRTVTRWLVGWSVGRSVGWVGCLLVATQSPELLRPCALNSRAAWSITFHRPHPLPQHDSHSSHSFTRL